MSAESQVRLLISDTADPPNQFFTDDEIAEFISIEGDSVKLAAALALEAIAGNSVQVDKVIQTRDGLKTDGAAVSRELRQLAASYRDQADSSIENDDDTLDFGIAEFTDTTFAQRERLLKQALTD